MGFSSMDDLTNEVTVNGKFLRADWNKLTHAVGAHVAGEWHSLFAAQGNPTAGVLSGGTNRSFQTLTDASPGGILHGGDVAPDTKHILNASAFSAAATTMPAVALLVDMLGFYPLTTVTTVGDQACVNSDTFTADNTTEIITHAAYDIANFSKVQLSTTTTLPAGLSTLTDYWTIRLSATTSRLASSLANARAGTFIAFTDNGTGTHTITVQLPRYSNGNGVQCFITPTTAMGAATPNQRITYTDADGNAGNLTPGTLPVGKTAAAIGIVTYSGTGAGKYGPFMPLASGDRGIRSIQQVNNSVSYVSGALSYVLAKPLLYLPMTTLGVAAERDLVNQLPSMPQVQDGACLSWLLYAGAATPANSPFYGHLDLGWG